MFAALVLAAAAIGAPDVYFVSVDTLRADTLGCYGYEYPTSPNIDTLARHGLVFEDCVAEVPLTSPSFCSMMASQPPRSLGTTRNGLPIGEDPPLVAELFQKAGYATMCVQSNWTLKRKLSALDRGFDVYEDDFHEKRWGIMKSERGADEVTDIALDLLERRDPGKPLFAWFHYSDPHAPYEAHDGFDPRGAETEDTSVSGDENKRRARVRRDYDSEVAFTDHHIGRLLAALPRENAYIVFVADHGESLYEHDYLGHGRRVYQPGLHIPLIIHGPRIHPARTAAPARGMDIGPTLLGLAGIKPPKSMQGMDLLGMFPSAGRVRIVETYGGAVPNVPGAKAIMTGKGPMYQAVLCLGWKLITDGKEVELYQLQDDPGELNNQAPEMPDRVMDARGLLAVWNRDTRNVLAPEAKLSKRDVEALKDLGYLD